jgi:hypothetical protein
MPVRRTIAATEGIYFITLWKREAQSPQSPRRTKKNTELKKFIQPFKIVIFTEAFLKNTVPFSPTLCHQLN